MDRRWVPEVWHRQRDNAPCWHCQEAAHERSDNHLEPTHTAPVLIHEIIDGLREWENAETMTPTNDGPSKAQNILGWQTLLEGRISLEWRAAQELYFKSIQARRSTARWASSLILELWKTAWDLWEHRNGILHDREAGRQRQLLKQEIAQEFALGARHLPSDVQRLFKKGETY